MLGGWRAASVLFTLPGMKTIKVGILGAGEVAKALARGFIALGHDVKLGARSPEKLDSFVSLLRPFDIVELVRSGNILMARALETT